MDTTTNQQESASLSNKTLTLDEKQQEAVNLCLDVSKRVVAVTGAAGSGKTTLFKEVHARLTEAGYNVLTLTPTGKAAKRVYEVTGIETLTIHRGLEYTSPGDPDPKTGKPVGYAYPQRTSSNRLEADVILVDEYAMVPQEVHRNLFAAIGHGCCIRVFGDNNQLAPIEEGNWNKTQEPSPFYTLLEKFPSVRLETIHRQGKDSGILLNLQHILRGRMPTKNEQWTMDFTDRPVDALRELVLENLDTPHDFRLISNQILTPQNKTWVGTVKLNAMVQSLFHNKLDPSYPVPRHKWVVGDNGEKGSTIRMYVGDKVIITRNNYNLFVFNGESGTIIEIDPATHEIVVDFGDREQAFPPVMLVQDRYGRTIEIDPRKDIDLGYVITVHKAQGSEYGHVAYILNKSTLFSQNRRNFYTACSRGREKVHLITDQRSIGASLNKKD